MPPETEMISQIRKTPSALEPVHMFSNLLLVTEGDEGIFDALMHVDFPPWRLVMNE
jgi:hypothetical protein